VGQRGRNVGKWTCIALVAAICLSPFAFIVFAFATNFTYDEPDSAFAPPPRAPLTRQAALKEFKRKYPCRIIETNADARRCENRIDAIDAAGGFAGEPPDPADYDGPYPP
jgi:hypothetical protein